jgi:hypothetical protein
VGYVSRFLEDPHQDHMGAVKHIVRYVAGTISWGLCYRRDERSEANLMGYCDSDYAGHFE